jgi:FMN-dependent oxidoreductase (nitrilotriacetate monooxygenase family)
MHDRQRMALGLMLSGSGCHTAAWRDPGSPVGEQINFNYFKGIAQAAERALYDMVFIADSLYVDHLPRGAERRYPRDPHLNFEPITLLSALAPMTTHVGLGGTLSTTYSAPYAAARAFASLDHISGGRAAWNVVTSSSPLEARNFGLDEQLDHSRRYAYAREHVEVVQKLWDSWEDGAIIADKASGIAFDPSKLHAIDHRGTHFTVTGPLNVSRSPQGRPVLIQAGSSGPGQDLAASIADVVFTAQTDIGRAAEFRRGLKQKAAAFGRDPASMVVLPGITTVIGRTEREAEEKAKSLQDLIDPQVGLAVLGTLLGGDLGDVDLDKPLPELADSNASKSRFELVKRIARDESLTVRQLYARLAFARGHLRIVGSAERIADEMTAWFKAGAADGFLFHPPVMPRSCIDFDTLVLPILRERGLLRTEYTGTTLRDHLGLARPKSPWA